MMTDATVAVVENQIGNRGTRMSSSVYRCECGQTFTKVGNGSMALFKNHLDSHSQNRAFFKAVLSINLNAIKEEGEEIN
jgi:hypothetical protein